MKRLTKRQLAVIWMKKKGSYTYAEAALALAPGQTTLVNPVVHGSAHSTAIGHELMESASKAPKSDVQNTKANLAILQEMQQKKLMNTKVVATQLDEARKKAEGNLKEKKLAELQEIQHDLAAEQRAQAKKAARGGILDRLRRPIFKRGERQAGRGDSGGGAALMSAEKARAKRYADYRASLRGMGARELSDERKRIQLNNEAYVKKLTRDYKTSSLALLGYLRANHHDLDQKYRRNMGPQWMKAVGTRNHPLYFFEYAADLHELFDFEKDVDGSLQFRKKVLPQLPHLSSGYRTLDGMLGAMHRKLNERGGVIAVKPYYGTRNGALKQELPLRAG